MSRLISLASGTLPEFDPVQVVHAAADGGFSGCGIWFDPETWAASTTQAVASAFTERGVVPLEIEVIAVKPGRSDPNHERLLEVGATIGATECIIVSSNPDLTAFKRRFAELCVIGDRVGVNLCLEFLPIFQVGDLRTALDVLNEVDHPRGRLLLDPLHVARSGTSIEDIKAIAPSLLSFAQFCDAPAPLPGEPGFDALLEEAIDGRLTPGRGVLPLGGLLDVLPMNLPLSLELRSKALRVAFPEAADRARHVYSETSNFLAGLRGLGNKFNPRIFWRRRGSPRIPVPPVILPRYRSGCGKRGRPVRL